MSADEIFSFLCGGGVCAVLILVAKLIYVKPIEIHPFQTLGKAIGRTINSEVLKKIIEVDEKVEKVDERVKELEAQQREYQHRSDEKDMNIHRSRILRAADEIGRKEKHSQEFFEQLLFDIDEYETYCKEHKDFENNKGQKSIDLIRATYQQCLAKHTFL